MDGIWRRARVVAIVGLAAASLIVTADQPVRTAETDAGTAGRAQPAVARAITMVEEGDRAGRTAGPGEMARLDGSHAVPLDAGQAASTLGVLVVDGGKHQCSASLVASDSRRILATAAHCVWLGGRWTLDGAYFVPGYRDGHEPWGRWPVDAAWVPRSWQEANSPIEDVASAHDVAFIRLATSPSGQLPEDALGSQGIWFNAPPGPTVTAIGYPVDGAFDGMQPERCTGPAHSEHTADGRPGSEGQIRNDDGSAPDRQVGPAGDVLIIDCDLTEGASGGPWLVGPQAQTGWGQVIGVVSGGSGPQLISARFGPEAEQVYHAADTGTDLEPQATR